jgi:hypothetical protein
MSEPMAFVSGSAGASPFYGTVKPTVTLSVILFSLHAGRADGCFSHFGRVASFLHAAIIGLCGEQLFIEPGLARMGHTNSSEPEPAL